ncbi:Gfo/Idh/MocA family oxidoreductase [Niabella sp. CC-SYL272]|uniref:Gfo/Idh/MocA family protein n=1 Tax=Niabella agricola TaxID=2891571 RepID=UPI001F1C4717|nr:Gfo/Idh/MocA family oxidoreductase [Niabella agricola]MCF3109871.1 Gfo/Idh/MocA family oxidoreductase [Niabella agricola]
MNQNRRDFLKIFGVLGAGAVSAGAAEASILPSSLLAPGVNMNNYRAPKLETVRIGFIGVGNRGAAAVKRVCYIENVAVNAICDIRPERARLAKESIKNSGFNPVLYTDKADDWMRLCERKDIDVVYIATHWKLHIPIAIYAMAHGKHVAMEIGTNDNIQEAWDLVKASETYQRHCIFLENCCYDFFELLTLNMARQGFFGEIIHGEGAYIHDIAESLFDPSKRFDLWRLRENANRNGNLYPTHGLGPICNIMNINRGDKMEYLVSMSSNDFTLNELEKEAYRKDPVMFKPFLNAPFRGNMNTSVIKTFKGKTIMLQHDTSSPRVYSRLHLISGTRAAAQKYPLPGRISVGHEDWLPEAEMKKIEDKYTLPLVKHLGEMAKQVGGHGGMDFLMDWRWVDCLRNGLPVDHNVYDAALWSSIGPLSEKSVAGKSIPVAVPDFTKGAWKTNAPLLFSIEHGNLTGVKPIKA